MNEFQNLLLSVNGLSVTYNNGSEQKVALAGVSFVLNKNSSLAIIGESGSGKTTIAYSLLSLVNIKIARVNGSIYFNGQTVLELNDKSFRMGLTPGISMVTQHSESALCPVKKVFKHFLLRTRMYDSATGEIEIRKKTIILLKDLGIHEDIVDAVLEAYPSELSGGQAQRVCIGLALSCEPKMIIFDEPTSELDVISKADLVRLLLSLRRRHGLSMIVLTHDISLVGRICDHIIVLKEGRIVEEGPTMELCQYPQEEYTKEILSSARTLS